MSRQPDAAPAAGPVTLPKADYYELRTAIRDLEIIELDAVKAAQACAARAATARARLAALYDALSETHGLDATVTYRWDDATCTLCPEEARAQ